MFDPFAGAVTPFPASATEPGALVTSPYDAPAPTQVTPSTMPQQGFGNSAQSTQQQQVLPHENSGANPFNVYGNNHTQARVNVVSPQSQSNMIVPGAQQANQWSVQPNPNPSPAPSVSSYNPNSYVSGYQSHHQAPQMAAPQILQTSYQTHPGMMSQQPGMGMGMVPASNQNTGYVIPHAINHQSPFGQTQHQPQLPVQAPPPTPPPVPATTAPVAVTVEDDDFFGDFANNNQNRDKGIPDSPIRPPSVFMTNEHDDVSYLSKSTNGTYHRNRTPLRNRSDLSPLEDPDFSPKPRAIQGLENARELARNAPRGSAPLPDFDLITHSGFVLARISFRTILIKKWKQIFWVTYGENKVLFFRSSADFEDWISNPYLTTAQRNFLVKLEVDFAEDLYKQNVRGYQVTNLRLKNYQNQMLHQFKLERWMDYGPTIAAAFASSNEREVLNLRTMFVELSKKNPQDRATPFSGSYTIGSSASGLSSPHSREYSNPAMCHSTASTSRLELERKGSNNSHGSNGIMSSGPVDRTMSSSREYVAGYRVTSRVGRY